MTAVPPWLDLDHLEAAVRAGDDHQWLTDGLCIGQPYEVFFPAKNTEASYTTARRICEGCPVKYQCLAAHLHEDHGCFGETSPRVRKAVRNTITTRREVAA